MTGEVSDLFTGLYLPNADGLVVGRCGQLGPIGGEGDGSHGIPMAGELAQQLARRRIPQANAAVPATDGKKLTIRGIDDGERVVFLPGREGFGVELRRLGEAL